MTCVLPVAGTSGTKLMYKLPPSTLTSASSLHNEPLTPTVESTAALVNPAEPVQQQQQQPPAAAVRAKMMASGYYARCALSPDRVPFWYHAGVPLDPASAQTFRWGSVPEWDAGKTEAQCQQKCDDSVVCWGFLYDADARACMYKGGEDALRSRAFFVMPNMTVVSSGAVPSEGAPVIGGGGNSGGSNSSSGGSNSSSGNSGSNSGSGTQCTPNKTQAYTDCFCQGVTPTQVELDRSYADRANNCTGASRGDQSRPKKWHTSTQGMRYDHIATACAVDHTCMLTPQVACQHFLNGKLVAAAQQLVGDQLPHIMLLYGLTC
jgi:hypothetical protein